MADDKDQDAVVESGSHAPGVRDGEGKGAPVHGSGGGPLPGLKWIRLAAVAAALGLSGGTGIWLGSQDVLFPVSLTAQILGGTLVVAGVAALVGTVLVIAARKALYPPLREREKKRAAYVAAAALAGCYITLTIVVHAFRYELIKTLIYGISALLCLALVFQTLPRAWSTIAPSVKNIGITLGVLGGIISFWYQSFYLPENSQVGIQYGFSVVSVTSSGSDRLVTLQFTMEDQSSVAALTLGSMVIVDGLVFPDNSTVSNTVQQNIDKYAQYLATPPAGPTSPNPNIGSTGNPSSVILAVMRPVNNEDY